MVLGSSPYLVGRDAELGVLRHAVDGARSGRSGVVVIEGEPGIGKTRLAAELPDQLLTAADLVIRGHGLQLAGGELAYGVAAELLRDTTRQLGVDFVRARAGAHAPMLAALDPALDGTLPAQPVDRSTLFAAFHELLLSLADEHLVCVLVDDLQWVDASSRDLLTFLAKVSSRASILMVCTVRTTRIDVEAIGHELTELARSENSQTVTLGPLGTDEVRALVEGVLGAEPPPQLLDRVQQRCDGVPLFVEELASSGDLSTTLRLNLADHLADLSAGAQQYLEAAAVAEGHVFPDLVARVIGLDPQGADHAREELVSTGVLEVATPERDRFRHALFRDAVLGDLSRATRRAWHVRWARALSDDPGPLPVGTRTAVAATHWYASGDRTREALTAAVAAARVAGHREALVETALWWERVLELWPRDVPFAEQDPHLGLSRDDVLLLTIRSATRAGIDTRQTMTLLRDEAGADPDASRVKQLYLRVDKARHVESTTGVHQTPLPPDQVPALLRDLISEPIDEFHRTCEGLLTMSYSAVLPQDLIESVSIRIEEVARGSGAIDAVAGFLQWRGYLLTIRGDVEGTVAAYREWDTLYDRASDVRSSNLYQFLWNLVLAGEYEIAASAVPPRVLESADPDVLTLWRDSLEETAWAWMFLGRWNEVDALLDRLTEVLGPAQDDHLGYTLLSRLETRRGNPDRAQEHLDGAYRLVAADEVGCPRFWTREVALAQVELHLARGDVTVAWALLERIMATALHGDGVEVDWETPLLAARTLDLLPSTPPRAADLVRSAAARVVALGRLEDAWRQEVCLRLDSINDPQAWRDVVNAWDAAGVVYHAVVARTELAAALLRVRERREATEVIGDALAVAEQQLHAAPLVQQLRRMAASARLPVPGAGSAAELPVAARRLTARELEVLALLAAGRTNADIAAELFMSPKTASVHVSHIIAKLDVTNRTEAAAYAHRHGILPPTVP